MNMIRAKGIPFIITIFAILVGLGGTFLGVQAIIDPSTAIGYVNGADSLAVTWAGRNAGLGIALLVAVFLRNPTGYAVAFAGSIFREISDILDSATNGGGLVIGLTVFMIIEIICFVISLRASMQTKEVKAALST